MAKGKLVLRDGSSLSTSTSIIIIDLGLTSLVSFNGVELKIKLIDGEMLKFGNLSVSETAEVSEFVVAYARSTEDQVIYKEIQLG